MAPSRADHVHRCGNIAHLVADSVADARRQRIEVFSRDRADLGPAHAARMAADDIERCGPNGSRRRPALTPRRTIDQEAADQLRHAATHYRPKSSPSHGIGICDVAQRATV